MELTLDSGETRTLRVGDVVVQRGTMHGWRNPSATEWARVVFFLVGAEAVTLEGGEVMRGFLPWAGTSSESK
jgi:quercetin dioxygenase-like cupin family protein